jgi:Tfp pilus assembly protein PilO
MEINKYFTKNKLISICIIIIILIIVRIFYNELYNNDIEGFELTETLNKDLLSKYKSTDAQESVSLNNANAEMQIRSWSNKIYNMQNTTQQSKAIAFYKTFR